MRDLWGIDDPTVRQEIQRAEFAARRGIGKLFLSMLGVGIMVVIVSLMFVHSQTRWPGMIAGALSYPCFMLISNMLTRRQMAAARIATLRRMDRCLKCGYKLVPEQITPCPECGLIPNPDIGSASHTDRLLGLLGGLL